MSDAANDQLKHLQPTEDKESVATRHGKPAGFESEEDWFDYRLEHAPPFLRRVAAARESLRVGAGMRLEDFEVPCLPE